jgi:cytochrome c
MGQLKDLLPLNQSYHPVASKPVQAANPERIKVVRFSFRKWALGLGMVAAVAAVTVMLIWGRSQPELHKPLPYLYQDTRQLVIYVNAAARLVEKRGPAAFREFAVRGSRWFNNRHYLFVYDNSGVCLFHPAIPQLEGWNLLDFKDIDGRPVGRWINEIGHQPGPDASGWLFYKWQSPNDLTATWKMSYVRKAIGPNGKIYLVGSGLHNFKIEPIFVRQCVNRAVKLLKSRGEEFAFARFRDRASRFFFCGTYIYVMNDKGQCLVDPAFPHLEMRDLTTQKDALGHYMVKEMLQRLQKHNSAWVQYMIPRPGSNLPSRKLAYLRKVEINGQTLIVGADFFQATPIWMKP